MIINKIKYAFQNRENALLALVSLFLAFNSFLFVYRAIKHVNFIPSLFWGLTEIYLSYAVAFFLYLGVLFYILRNPVSFLTIVRKTLLMLFPAVAILDWGFYSHFGSMNKMFFSNFFIFFTSFYVIGVGFYLLFRYKKYENFFRFLNDFKDPSPDPEETTRKETWRKKYPRICKIPAIRSILSWFFVQGLVASLVLVSVIGFNIAFGSYHLSEFAAVDEPLWTYDRIPKFWNNVKDGEFFKTMVSDKPGITVAIISGVGLNWTNPYKFKSISWEGETNENYPDIREMNFAMRFPIFIFNALMLVVFYVFLKKLLGKSAALFSLILIGLSPLLIGISTIINPDSLLWVFTPLSLLAYFIYLKDNSNKYLYLSGIFLGLSILTKYVANLLYVFFFGMIFLEYIINKHRYENISLSEYFKNKFYDYFVIIFFSLATFFFLLPAAWVNIGRLGEGTIFSKAFLKVWPLFLIAMAVVFLDTKMLKNKLLSPTLNFLEKYKDYLVKIIVFVFLLSIFFAIVITYSGMHFYNLESILASPKSSGSTTDIVGLILANFYSMIFGIIPVSLLAILFLTFKILISKEKNHNFSWPFYIIVFILIYYIASSVDSVSATVRYQIIIYPLAFILAAIGIEEFFKIKTVRKYFILRFAYLVFIVFCLYSLNSIKPFYFSYASDLLPQKYILNLKDMGDGSFEAAQYLNNLPHPEKLMVWTDKRGVCAFFIGSCQSGFDFDKNKTVFDYFVVSSGRETRTSRMTLSRVNGGNSTLFRLDKLYEIENPEYKLEIGGRPNNFVKIISAKEINN